MAPRTAEPARRRAAPAAAARGRPWVRHALRLLALVALCTLALQLSFLLRVATMAVVASMKKRLKANMACAIA